MEETTIWEHNSEGAVESEPVEEAVSSGQTEEQQGDSAREPEQVTDEAYQPLTVKYNGSRRQLSREEAVAYAQKGMNYDKIHDKLKAYEENGAMKRAYSLLEDLSARYGISPEEYLDGILRQRSGYEKLCFDEECGEILAIKAFNNNYYCVTSNQFLSVNQDTFQKTVLMDGMSNVKGGTFLVKNDILYYFSGKEIYKIQSYLSTFTTQETTLIDRMNAIELEKGIYTDGSVVYQLDTGETYSIGDSISYQHVCRYGDTLYFINKPKSSEASTTIHIVTLQKENGLYAIASHETREDTLLQPHHYSGETSERGTFIRFAEAVKGYLLFQLDVIKQRNHGDEVCPFYARMTAYNLATGQYEYDRDSAAHKGEVFSRCGDVIVTYDAGYRYDTNAGYVIQSSSVKTKNYETGEEKSYQTNQKLTDVYLMDPVARTNVPLRFLPSLTAVSEDSFLITGPYRTEYFSITGQRHRYYFTRLFKLLENGEIYLLDERKDNACIGLLKPFGSNFYELPISFLFDTSLKRTVTAGLVSVFNFSKDSIQQGQSVRFSSDDETAFGYYDFMKCNDAYCQISTSEFIPTAVKGYTPTVLNARYNATLSAYEMLSNEAYNFLSNQANIKVLEASDSVKTMDIPVAYHMIDAEEGIQTDGSGSITAKSNENGGTTLTNTKAFEVGETITFTTVNAAKTNPVRSCHLAVPYGGSSYTEGSGTRLFAAGNPEEENTYYYSEVNNFEYFPELNFDILENSSASITGFAKHYQDLIVFQSDSISKISYQYNDGKVVFPVVNVHDSIGCDMPGSIQTVNNDVIFGNALRGLHLLSVKESSDQRNVFAISMNLNGKKGLGKYSVFEKQNARSFDFKNKYYLAIGDDVYLWNYELTPFQGYPERLSWYVWRNLPIALFYAVEGYPAFAPRDSFALYAFNGAKDDDGKAIRASFTTKAFDFGDANAWKAVRQVWMNITSNKDFPLYFKSVNERGECLGHIISFRANRYFGNVMTRRLKHKRILYLGFHLENGEQGTAFDVSDIKMEYEIYKSRR